MIRPSLCPRPSFHRACVTLCAGRPPGPGRGSGEFFCDDTVAGRGYRGDTITMLRSPLRASVRRFRSWAVWIILLPCIFRSASAEGLIVVNDSASGPGSFRDALMKASGPTDGEGALVIGFDEEFFAEPRTIVLADPMPEIRRSVVIEGPPLGASGEPMVTLSGDTNGTGVVDVGDAAGLHIEVPAGGEIVLQRLRFAGCRSTAKPGGAVYFRPDDPARLTVEDCVFTGNVARWGGAISVGGEGHEVTLRGCAFVGNVASVFDGGAVHLGSTPALVEDCIFRQNTAPHGGALHTFHGETEIRGCLFEANQTAPGGRGGAISARAGLRIIASAFVDNSARTGGALFLTQMTAPAPGAYIENSTFSGNQATTASGGAIYAVNVDALLRHVTLTLNHANSQADSYVYAGGGAISIPGAASENRIRLHNCLIADNRISGPGPADTADLQGPVPGFVSLAGNVIGVGNHLAAAWSAENDRFGTLEEPLQPLLEPLDENGGALPTHMPAPDSPAVDAGVPGPDPVVPVDQRGLPRPGGDAPDAGAVELVVLGYPAWARVFLAGLDSPSPDPGGQPVLSPLQQPDSDPDQDGIPNIREYFAGTDPVRPSIDRFTIHERDAENASVTLRFRRAAYVPPGSVALSVELSETGHEWRRVSPTPPVRFVRRHGGVDEFEVVVTGLPSPAHLARLGVERVGGGD